MVVLCLSGPMTGLSGHNRETFFHYEAALTRCGFVVLNPARNPLGLTRQAYMDIGMAMVRHAEIVGTLPGYKQSSGALAEIAYARSLGVEHKPVEQLLKPVT